ncbi:DUF4296 domain-containing protein [Chitinophaga rhizophila]|uniref:DUF4296 domain-containing protein n=1 Tax=Chitinophaga rhizophila TaxID=2866212 RepID=A0ABS7GG42_9BACT|nr:DUF4296 domain-containing protein [Chitinophaga rhizophila]MBW8685468.1 DUF4296 domain-containing protein [Chitinophaga rhizophila]
MYRIIAVCLVLLITACGEADKVPADVLPKEKMRDVLLDMNLADSYAGLEEDGISVVVSDSVRKERLKVYYRQILDLHKLTPQEFDHSFKYYESHPDKLKNIYDMMFSMVSKDKESLDADLRNKEYTTNINSLLPVNNNTIIWGGQDTLIPFVKKDKRSISVPVSEAGPKLAQPKPVKLRS